MKTCGLIQWHFLLRAYCFQNHVSFIVFILINNRYLCRSLLLLSKRKFSVSWESWDFTKSLSSMKALTSLIDQCWSLPDIAWWYFWSEDEVSFCIECYLLTLHAKRGEGYNKMAWCLHDLSSEDEYISAWKKNRTLIFLEHWEKPDPGTLLFLKYSK